MKILIAGSRRIPDQYCLSWIDRLSVNFHRKDTIISGGADGVDSCAEAYCKERFIAFELYRADWNKYGKGAGFLRNSTMVEACDVAYILWDGESRGTKDTIDKMLAAKKEVHIYIKRLE